MTTSRRQERFAWASALLLVAVIGRRGRHVRASSRDPRRRGALRDPDAADDRPVSLAISPDGQKIVFVATSEGVNKLWLRRLGSACSRAVGWNRRRDGAFLVARQPPLRSSPLTDNRLKRIDIDGRSRADAGNVTARYRRYVEPRRHDSLFNTCRAGADLPHLLRWWRNFSGHAAGGAGGRPTNFRSSYLMGVISCTTLPDPTPTWRLYRSTSMDRSRGACSKRMQPRCMSPRDICSSSAKGRCLRKPSIRTRSI